VEKGAPVKLAAACAGAWNTPAVTSAEGYVLAGGPAPGVYSLRIVGCASSAAASEGLSISVAAMAPGDYGTGTGVVQYTDPSGSTWGFNDDAFKVTITKLGMRGDIIEGTFTATVSHVMNGNAAQNLSGSFSVCHQPDELVP
jgi:hypothetical protein